MEEKFSTIIFKDKTLSDILEEIHTNSKAKEESIDSMIGDMRDLIENLGDAISLAPIIANYVKLSIDNNEHLIKMAAIVQKVLDKGKDNSAESLTLFSEKDKQELQDLYLEMKDNFKLPDSTTGKLPTSTKKVKNATK